MSTILVVDDMPMCREPIAEALRHHGHKVSCADGGAEALDILRDQPTDLVLLDVTMPQPDGMAVLKIMRRNSDLKSIPVILLTDRAEQDIVIQAAKWGVDGYLLKSNFSLDVLLARVDACLGKATTTTVGTAARPANTVKEASVAPKSPTAAAPPPAAEATPSPTPTIEKPPDETVAPAKPITSLLDLEPIITKEQLTKVINDGLKLKPLAGTVHNVMAITGSTGCCAADVAKAVANDHALSIRLLKLANSSAYSRGHPVDNVQTAVQRIGIHEVRQLVMTLGVFDQYVGCESTRIDIRLFWEHSIACGLIAAAIARECQFKAVDECFLWGILHDVGRVILLDHAADEYDQVCNVADELEVPLEVVERKLLTANHCEILKDALEHWQFPHTFIGPVVNHHEVSKRIERLGPEHAQPALIVALANRIAHALLLGCSGNEMVYPFDGLVASLGLEASALERIAAAIPDETRDLRLTMLMHAASDNWPDFGGIVRARLDTEVRPLCASREPATDAFTLFLDRIGEHNDTEPPNLGVLYVREAGEAPALFAQYENREAEAECGSLPLIVICGKRAAKLDQPPWQDRRHTVLRTPVPIARFLRTIQAALAEVVEA